jgi:UDP-N-acetyl-D-glucosamine dehydrogenase
MEKFKERGAEVAYFDPFVPVIRPTREHPHWAGTKSIEWKREIIGKFDAVVIATNHKSVNYQELADWSDCIIDSRNAMIGINLKAGQLWKA